MELPQFADVNAIGALGYASIGDAGTGTSTGSTARSSTATTSSSTRRAPESLVFAVDKATGSETLVVGDVHRQDRHGRWTRPS